jgi:multisubunit Na+/H+ antiporter MnhB subunit
MTTITLILVVAVAVIALVLLLDWLEQRSRRRDREIARRIHRYLSALPPRQPW